MPPFGDHNGCCPICRNHHEECHVYMKGMGTKMDNVSTTLKNHITDEEADVKQVRRDVGKMKTTVDTTGGKLTVLMWIMGIAATGLVALAVGVFLLVLERIP